jgi:hypothetical protein
MASKRSTNCEGEPWSKRQIPDLWLVSCLPSSLGANEAVQHQLIPNQEEGEVVVPGAYMV